MKSMPRLNVSVKVGLASWCNDVVGIQQDGVFGRVDRVEERDDTQAPCDMKAFVFRIVVFSMSEKSGVFVSSGVINKTETEET
jgi:hypothetical protein